MLSADTVTMMVMLIVTWPCGTILNSSIIAIYLSNWKNGVKLGECDLISLIMGCNNLLFQSFITFLEAIDSYGQYLPSALKVSYGVGTVNWFLIYLSFWLTACLSICYCLRLANFSHKFFILLKRRLFRTVTPLLLCSVAISLISTLPAIWISSTEANQNNDNMSNADLNYMLPALATGTCLPFLITCICILLSVISLLKHIRRMKQNTEFGSPQLKNLIRACRTMILLMTLNFIFFLINFSLTITSDMGIICFMVLLLVGLLNPSGQAIVLIFGNSKLLSAWIKILSHQ